MFCKKKGGEKLSMDKEIRYERNPDGTYTVTYGNKVVRAKDQIEAGRVLEQMITEDLNKED